MLALVLLFCLFSTTICIAVVVYLVRADRKARQRIGEIGKNELARRNM